MSFINFFSSDYQQVAKGIIYAIYKILWKVVYAIGELIDAVTGLFYKLAGLDYLGSGSESLVENTDLFSQIFNQNVVSSVSLFMIFASISLMAVFGGFAVIKKLYFSKGESKSTVDIIKNMGLAAIFLLCLTPISLFAISTMSTITTGIASIFGNDMNVSISDVIFKASFKTDYLETYNAIYSSKVLEGEEWINITSWVQMTNGDFLFDMTYSGVEHSNDFYWYVFLLGGGVVLYNVVVMAFRILKRIFNVVVLYLLGPLYVAKMVDDGGVKFREWKSKALSELVSIVGTVVAFMVLLSLVSMIDNLELISNTTVSNNPIDNNFGVMSLADSSVEGANSGVNLINNLAKILLLMAGTSVAKDSGELLGNLFKQANEEGNSLLEGIYDRLATRENRTTNNNQSAPRTRVITKTTTSNKRIVNYTENIPSSGVGSSGPSIINSHTRNNINTTVNNVDRRTSNIQNRANVSISESTGDSSVKKGAVKSTNQDMGSKFKASEVLDKTFASYKAENDKLRNEWEFMKNGNSSDSQQVVKDFENASKGLESSINSGEPARIKNSMNQYVDAYKKEEKVAKEGYKDFAGKSAKLTSDLTSKQQDELKKISSAYKKAQMDYGKTARKLSEVSQGNMSASEALRLKENADKQRAKLMEASNKANSFYNNQKKGG